VTISAFTMYAGLIVLQMPFTQLGGASDVPLMMRLFPAKQYGQFSSANALVRHFTNILASAAGATFIGVMVGKYGYAGDGFAFLWHGTFQTLAVICVWIVFFIWRRSGAENFSYDAERDAPAREKGYS
jgi:hypothetical protein